MLTKEVVREQTWLSDQDCNVKTTMTVRFLGIPWSKVTEEIININFENTTKNQKSMGFKTSLNNE